MMKKVIITGATSFIATHLIAELSSKDYKIYAVIRKNSSNKNKLLKYPNLNIIELDLENIEDLSHCIPEKCDTMFHFAWNGTRGETRDDLKLQKRNVDYSINTLKVAKELGCTKFFTAGSQAEYGIQNNLVNEETKCNPVTEYGKAKYAFYQKACEFCIQNKITFFEIRIFSIYGPNDFEATLITSTLKKMLANEDIKLSSCEQNWNYLYVKDLISALIMLDNANIEGGIFNLASNETKKLKEFILEMKKITNSSSKIEFGTYTPNGINPDISKIKRILNWQENYNFNDGIIEIIETMKEDE